MPDTPDNLSRDQRPAQSGRTHDDLVNRLDALSQDETQRVLERAIRLQMDRHVDGTFSRSQIARVAAELGVDPQSLESAFHDEVARRAPSDPSQSWFLAGRLVERVSVEGNEGEVADHVMAWMESEEGLRAVSRTGDGMVWERDKGWATSARLAFGSHGTKALRGLPEVRHRQISVDSIRQVVEIDVPTDRIKATALGVGGGIAALGTVAGIGIAAGLDGSNLVEFMSGFLPGIGIGGAVALITAKAWAQSVQRGIERALQGIANPDLHQRALRRRQRRSKREDRRPESGIKRMIEEVADIVEEIFDD